MSKQYQLLQADGNQLSRMAVGGWGGNVVASTTGDFQMGGKTCNAGCWDQYGGFLQTPVSQITVQGNKCGGSSQWSPGYTISNATNAWCGVGVTDRSTNPAMQCPPGNYSCVGRL